MKTNIIALICIFISFFTNAQEKFKYGKISKTELTKSDSEIAPGAHAEVLGEYGYLYFKYHNERGLYFVLEYTKRIKIYDEEGYDYADIQVPYFDGVGESKETLSTFKGNVYNLVDGKVEKTKTGKTDIIIEELSNNWKSKTLTLPKVKSGSVIEYNYVKTSDYFSNLEDWTFQESIPVIQSQYIVRIPEWFKFEIVSQGFLNYSVYETNTVNDGSPGGVSWTSSESKWVINNAVPLENEPYITTKENYTSKLNFQLISLQYPNSPLRIIAGSYEKYNKELLTSSSWGGAFRRRKFISETVASLTDGLSSDKEKALAIYSYVRNEMTRSQGSSIYPQNIRKAFNTRKGTSAHINFLLTIMLKEAGLNADPVILSTRSRGLLHPIYLNKSKFNYVISLIKFENGYELLDASNKGYPFGTLPTKALNNRGWVVSETQPGWIPLKGNRKAERAIQIKLNLNEDGILSGTMKETTKGYADINRRIKIYNDGKDKYNESLDEDLPLWSVDSISIQNEDNVYKPLITECNIVNSENEDSEIIYLNPVIVNNLEENPFSADTRMMPIDIPYGNKDSYIMEIIIPEGYEVAELPKPAIFQLPNKAATFQFSSSHFGNKISVINNYKLNGLLFTSDEYQNIKKFFELMINKQSEQIVIKKI